MFSTQSPASRLLILFLAAVLLGVPLAARSATDGAAISDPPAAVAAARAFRQANEVTILQDFRALLAMPNVSSSLDDMSVNADWISAYLKERGFSVETVSAGRAPYIIAQRSAPDAESSLLIYAHFDGQPVDADEWHSSPFTPTLRDGSLAEGASTRDWDALRSPVDPLWRIYGRSAGDDKAPIIALATALDALDTAGIAPSVNLTLILDGEEEAGSPTLGDILTRYGDRLDADLLLFCDGPMHQSRRRQLVFGVRGSVTVELTAYGPNRPLHSGHYGNWAPNPTDALIQLLATLRDAEGRILVPGYYDAVVPPSDAELAAIAAMPTVDDRLQRELGLARREGGEERIERLVLDPAIVVKGLQAGGVGAQSANVIRPTARASLNLRLVPDQTPERVVELLGQHFAAEGAHVVTTEPTTTELAAHANVLWMDARGGYPGFRTDLSGPDVERLVRLLDAIDGESTLLTPTMGGSLPIHLFEEMLGIPVILLPVANHDNNQHGADENLRIQNLWDAIDVYAAVIAGFGR